MSTAPIRDAQVDFALRSIRAKINENCEGYFDASAVRDVIEHCPASGPQLLRIMAQASLPILLAEDAERIITNRSKALYAFVVLQDRIGEARLRSHISGQEGFSMCLVEAQMLKQNRVSH